MKTFPFDFIPKSDEKFIFTDIKDSDFEEMTFNEIEVPNDVIKKRSLNSFYRIKSFIEEALRKEIEDTVNEINNKYAIKLNYIEKQIQKREAQKFLENYFNLITTLKPENEEGS